MKRWGLILILVGVLLNTPKAQAQYSSAYQQGVELLEQGNYQAARQQFRKSLELIPGHPESYFGLGVCFFQLKNYNQAQNAYQKALKYIPSPRLQAQIRGGLGDIYFQLENYPQAVSQYQYALGYQSNWSGTRYKLSQSYLKLKQYKAALTEVRELKKAAPNLIKTERLLGDIYLNQKNFKAAISAYQSYIKKSPKVDFEVYRQMNWLYRIQGDYPKALTLAKYIRKHYTYNPESALLYGDTLTAYFYDCKLASDCPIAPSEIINYYERLELQNSSTLSQARLAHAYQLGQKYKNSAYYYKKTYYNTGDTNHLLKAFEMQWAMGDKQAVIKALKALPPVAIHATQADQFAQLIPDLSPYLNPPKIIQGISLTQNLKSSQSDFENGMRMLNAKQYKWAEALFHQARKKQAQSWKPYLGLGTLYKKQKQWEKAKQAFFLAHLSHPTSLTLIQNLAESYKETDNEKHLTQLYQHALKIHPSNSKLQTQYLQHLNRPHKIGR